MIGKIFGNADTQTSSKLLADYMLEDEVIYLSFKFIRDEMTLTSEGIYYIDVQGLTGSKIQVDFYPARSIESIGFETAGTLDFDSDLTIHVKGKKDPINIKVSRKSQDIAKQIIKIMKKYYFN